MNYLSLTAIFKNEAPYLVEWLCYYRLLGVEKFYLYDDCSQDDFKNILKKVPFQKDISLFKLNLPRNVNRQNKAYSHSATNFKNQTHWMIFCDVDEYIMPNSYQFLNNFLQNYEKTSGLGVFWKCYGSSWRLERPNGLILESYLNRSFDNFGPNKHIKSIINMQDYIGCCSPHFFKTKTPIVDENFNPIITYPKTPGYCDRHTSEIIRINHYIIKSHQDFLIKQSRGRGTSDKYREDNFFETYDNNDVYDPTALIYANNLKLRYKIL